MDENFYFFHFQVLIANVDGGYLVQWLNLSADSPCVQHDIAHKTGSKLFT